MKTENTENKCYMEDCCPKCKSKDLLEISDNYTKCINCNFEFVG